MRADVEWVAGRQWVYCVLDEGHIIRNPKAKITQVAFPVLLSGPLAIVFSHAKSSSMDPSCVRLISSTTDTDYTKSVQLWRYAVLCCEGH